MQDAGQIIMFSTADGTPFSAVSALEGQSYLLVDAHDAVFRDHNHTINMRIEVSDRFVISKGTAHPISTPTVAGIRWMGCTGERHVSQANGFIKLLHRSES